MIKSLTVKDRISKVCASGVTDVTKMTPRSLEEVQLLLKELDAGIKKHTEDLQNLIKALKVVNTTAPGNDDIDYVLLNKKPESAAVEEATSKKDRAIILDDDVKLTDINKQKIESLKTPLAKKKKGTADDVPDEVIEFVKPKNLPKIKEQYDLLEELANKKEQLESIINNLALNFKGHRGSGEMIANAKALHATVTQTLNRTLAFLNNVAIKTEPADFAAVVKKIVDQVNPVFEDSYDKVEQSVYVSTSEVKNKETGKQQTALTYTHYVMYKNFVDDEGYIHDKFFLVLTGILIIPSKGGKPILRKYVTTLQKFVVPGKFKPGTRFRTADEGAKFAFLELEHENFSTLVERTPIPANKRDVDRILAMLPAEWIRSGEIKDNIITIVYNPAKINKSNISSAIKETFAAISTMIRGRSKSAIKYRQFQDGKAFGADFILVKPDADDIRPSRVDVSTLRKIVEYIKTEVDLDEEQEKEIIRILNS